VHCTERLALVGLLWALALPGGWAQTPGEAAPAQEAVINPSGPLPARPRYVRLPAPAGAPDWDAFKLQAGERLVQAHPDSTYRGAPPEPLYAIPVLEIELNANGSVRHVRVVREPREAKETIRMAVDAVHRAAPYGDVSRLPKPWKFVEVFLFDENLRFKPASIDR
jgi:hypothetical protein